MTGMTGYTYGPAEIAAIICILTVMLSVRRITDVIPSMLGCLFRWKEAFNLEYSVRLSRNRNITFIVLTVPACLLAARFRLYDPDFMSEMTPPCILLSSDRRKASTIRFRIPEQTTVRSEQNREHKRTVAISFRQPAI